MSTLNPKTRRTVAAGLVVALGLMAPVGAAVADDKKFAFRLRFSALLT